MHSVSMPRPPCNGACSDPRMALTYRDMAANHRADAGVQDAMQGLLSPAPARALRRQAEPAANGQPCAGSQWAALWGMQQMDAGGMQRGGREGVLSPGGACEKNTRELQRWRAPPLATCRWGGSAAAQVGAGATVTAGFHLRQAGERQAGEGSAGAAASVDKGTGVEACAARGSSSIASRA